jgi:integrase
MATPKKFTGLTVKNARPAAKRQRIPVNGRGLCLHVEPKPSGALSWHDWYRHNGRLRNLRLGTAVYLRAGEPEIEGKMTLAQALVAFAENRRKLERGVDPGERKADKAPPAPETFEAVARECLLAGEADGMRSARAQLSNLERHVFPAWQGRPITEIKRSDLAKLRDEVTKTVRAKERERRGPDADVSARGKDMAAAVAATVGKVLNWYANERRDTYVPPLVRTRRKKPPARSRILRDDELSRVWAAAEDDGTWFGPFLQFSLLTGCRRSEAARMRASEIVNGVWSCPASRSKTKEEIVRPLSQAAQVALARMPRIASEHGYIFTVNGKVPVGNFTRPKAAFDKASGVVGWRTHDLRRTCRSLLARAGVPSEVAERALGHKLPRMEAVYNVHRYQEELSSAYQKLATLIANITHPQANVTPLRA